VHAPHAYTRVIVIVWLILELGLARLGTSITETRLRSPKVMPILPEDLSPYMNLKGEGIARLVLCLLVEEMLGRQLAAFRLKQLHTEPVEGEKELAVGRCDVVTIGDRPW
jgi:hypothetical protein